ncbi:MAG: class II aldolase/adducin family protein [Pirellulaceae bacterium]
MDNEFGSERKLICEIGNRMYNRQFCAANEGNISIRLGENRVLCTPTLHCKGFMNPEDLCIVDMQGNQVSGNKNRTSEILLHLEIYRQRSDVDSVVHCHPPHATAFAITGEPIPMGVLPEPEIFLGEVPTAPYVLPGTQEFANSITPFVHNTNTIVLASHGVVSFDKGLERAYWLTEILDSYCRTLIHSRQIGPINRFSPKENRDLLELRARWGFSDPRLSGESPISDEELSNHPSFRETWSMTGVARKAF